MRTTATYALVAGLLGASFGIGAALADTIVLVDGRTLKDVKVTSETYEEIEYTIHNSKQTEEAANVARISYERTPISYKQAEELMNQGQFLEAARAFESAKGGREKWVDQYALFYAGESYRAAGDHSGASRSYKALLQNHPKTRFFPAAKLGLGLTLAAQSDHAGARSAFSELESEARSKGFGERWQLQAQLQTASAFEAEGNGSKANGLYRRLVSKKISHPDIGFAARLGELRTGGGSRSVRDLQTLIDEEKAPEDVRAGAYVALGKAQREAGDHQASLMSFLRVCLDPALSNFPAHRAEALHLGAQQFEQVKGKDWSERANKLRNELRSRYPNSPFAK
ncbi:MAG: tetratricopeptide repeat protein [Planctomycetota bacterium]|jgi:tetratricopeptide (TPR) repeat protein